MEEDQMTADLNSFIHLTDGMWIFHSSLPLYLFPSDLRELADEIDRRNEALKGTSHAK